MFDFTQIEIKRQKGLNAGLNACTVHKRHDIRKHKEIKTLEYKIIESTEGSKWKVVFCYDHLLCIIFHYFTLQPNACESQICALMPL